MFEVPYGQDPYSAIGRYIRENITAIEDIIAVIDINGVETNELFLVYMQEDGYFVWESDWWEGEKNVSLVDFFPVSDAQKPSAQPEPLTDKEQRIFLAAMGREEKVCEEVDRNHVREPYEDSLMSVCREIKRKVKGALWT